MLKKKGIFLSILSLFLVSNLGRSCETHRQVFIENAQTKVWQTTLCPHELLAYHNHQFPRVLIPQTDGVLQVKYRSGKKVILKLQQQIPIFLDFAQGKELHQDINLGEEAVKVLVIELKQGR